MPPQTPQTPDRTRARALAWGLVLLWAAFIWSLGSDGFSMSSTSRFIGPFLEWLAPGLSPADLNLAMVGIRSSAHAAEYGLFALLVFRALRLSSVSRWVLAACGALAGVLMLAVADEARQSFSPARTGSSFHVWLDLVGGVLSLSLLLVIERWRNRRS
jgi:VanZ family protein